MNTGSNGNSSWKFDGDIAPVFVEHARRHIPNYEVVTDKCARYCELNLHKDDKIIDVGCATGHTLKKLHSGGFINLHGVDNSKFMIDLAPKDIATYTVSDSFPGTGYSMILCNWTLHFIKDKIAYLESMYNGLVIGGTMILSDKTSTDSGMTKMYYDHKMKLGVTKHEIEEKQKQLEGVMFINDTGWYQRELARIGFTVKIVDADWCFTTFLCEK